MTAFRVAVVDDDDVVFQFQGAADNQEDAQAKVASAEAAYPDFTVRVERLDPDEVDEDGQAVSSVWNEVTV